ncbi:MAG: phosphotransacetylase [Alphaproteobacteria bacterium]|nr:phosphotransacetylase [Alphaproteobacteria bacterium]
MDILERSKQQIKGEGKRVALPESADERIIAAARHLLSEELAIPVMSSAAPALEGAKIFDPATDPRIPEFASALAATSKKLDEDSAAALLQDPLYFSGMLVRQGQADALVAGAAAPTADVLRAGLRTVGLAEGIRRMSSYFLMEVPDFLGAGPASFIFADCAVNIDPDADDLADIAIASAASAAKLLDEEPRVALLSFSTKASAQHELVDKVTGALEIIKQRAPELIVDGEFQADTALVPRVAATKVKGASAVAGRANVLIFPDLNSGNIGYKLTQYMAGAQAIGPHLQGFAKPVCDLSRGASVEDIVAATAITLANS